MPVMALADDAELFWRIQLCSMEPQLAHDGPRGAAPTDELRGLWLRVCSSMNVFLMIDFTLR